MVLNPLVPPQRPGRPSLEEALEALAYHLSQVHAEGGRVSDQFAINWATIKDGSKHWSYTSKITFSFKPSNQSLTAAVPWHLHALAMLFATLIGWVFAERIVYPTGLPLAMGTFSFVVVVTSITGFVMACKYNTPRPVGIGGLLAGLPIIASYVVSYLLSLT